MKEILLRLDHVSTEVNKVKGLSNFSLLLGAGEIVGLLTLNQQGVNDLLEILTQNKKIKSGKIFLNEAKKSTIKFGKIYLLDRKERHVKGMTIAENIFVLKKDFNMKIIKKKVIEQGANQLLKEYGVEIDASMDASFLKPLERCQVELIKAYNSKCRIIILQDLEKILSQSHLEILFVMIRHFMAKGMSFIYLNNYPDHILGKCSRIMIMENGLISKSIYPGQSKTSLFDYIQNKNEMMSLRSSKKEVVLELMASTLVEGQPMPFRLFKGECVTFFDRNHDQLAISLSRFFSGKAAGQIKINEKIKEASVFYIPENAIENTLFKYCSYMFNLMFFIEEKISRNLIPKKFYRSIQAEYYPVLGDCLMEKSLLNLDSFQLNELIYHRAILQKPDVVVIYQPFLDCDMNLQPYIVQLILKLKNKGVAVVIFTSYLAGLEAISEEIIKRGGSNTD